MPLSIVGFAAIYKTGFTPKMLGLGNVTGCDKPASVQGTDLYSITGVTPCCHSCVGFCDAP